ncbi:hypothetical protein L7F22_063934 [Adiantum nelumboides]|nr:hypothetical protein [Adiantum nelumboides]
MAARGLVAFADRESDGLPRLNSAVGESVCAVQSSVGIALDDAPLQQPGTLHVTSKYTWVSFLKLKSEAFGSIRDWKAMVEKEKDLKVKSIRSDRGGEFLSENFARWCKSEGIRRQPTTPYTPSQNGVVERKNRTIMEMARAMLAHASLPRSYWTEACNTASDAYRLYDPDTRTTTVSRDVVFDESFITSAEGAAAQPIPILPPPSLPDPPASPVITPSKSHPVPPIQPPDVSPDHALSDFDSDLDVADATPEVDSAPPRREKRILGWLYSTVASSGVTELPVPPPAGLPRRSARLQKRGQVYESNEFVNFALMSQIQDTPVEPSLVQEALQHNCWKRVMHAELDAIERNKTWTLVPRPPKRKVVSTKWIFKTKYKADGSLDKHKARLVARGFSQRPGVDFDETYAPTARMTTIRTVLCLAAHFGWTVFQMDVKSAFLNGEMEKEVYVSQPPGFQVTGKEDHVYRRLIWISDADYHGYAVDFLSLSMHAISRDPEAYPLPCIYTQIEADDEFDYGDDAGDELSDYQDSNDLSRVQEMRLVPSDPSVLDNLFKVLCDCALLNPDPVEEHEGEGEWFFNEEEVLAGAIGHSNGVKDHDVTGFSELHLDDEQFDDAEESEGEHPA